MRYCTNCGHQLGVGRYCTNCGARVPVPAGDAPATPADYPTAVRIGPMPPIPDADLPAAVPPPPPPPPDLGPEPSAARYPLYADAFGPESIVPALDDALPTPTAYDQQRRRSSLPWLIAFGVLALAALVGGALLLLGDEEPAELEAPTSSRAIPAGRTAPLVPAKVQVPDVAPPSSDESGERVTYAKTNMLDGDPRTAWRMPGDGTGSVLDFGFGRKVVITEVGLINGYAKDDPPHHWYVSNRRIREVVWVFDDGTEVVQELGKSKEVQSIPVGPIRTRRVELRILEVSNPGSGPDSRDFTAISDVAFTGR